LADDQDHPGAISLDASGADRSSPPSRWRHFRAATGSRNGPPAAPCLGWPWASSSVSASLLPSA